MPIWKRFIFGKRIVFVAVLLISTPVAARFLWHIRPRALRRLLELLWPTRKYSTYGSALQEDQYWAAAELYGRRLRSSDARFGRLGRGKIENGIPVVTSYMPALLPWYRQRRRNKTPEYYLSLRAVCKWHRMVFPGPFFGWYLKAKQKQWHPSVSQAFRLRESFSPEDKREIHRISRMLPDELVFGKMAKWKPKYRTIWRKWLANKDREVYVVFHD
ncbi:hypothetical protein K438DRAFT_1940137 [Mycena galopus ATCC 62051]|nr:hypothetical protein K438DRAFT_1940137 [Mycena galopus ATCC 62051]